ncbi:MAG: hypothetical protein V7752_10380 [Halopseudomonas sp.]
MKALILIVITTWLYGCESVPDQLNPFSPDALLSETEYSAQRQQALERALVVDPDSGATRFVGDTVYVIMSDFQFDPNQIRLKAGAITRIRLSNSAWVTHYFGGDEFFQNGAEVVSILGSNVPPNQNHIPVPPFTERDLYLYAKDPGEYPLNCFVPNHRNAGMKGVLIVETDEKAE